MNLLPDRVVRALNVNLDHMGAHSRFTRGYHDHHDAMIARGNGEEQKLLGARLLRPRLRFLRPAPPSISKNSESAGGAGWLKRYYSKIEGGTLQRQAAQASQ